MKLFIIIFSLFSFLVSNENNINAGPMVGYSEKMEVALWIQTKTQAEIKFLYWDV